MMIEVMDEIVTENCISITVAIDGEFIAAAAYIPRTCSVPTEVVMAKLRSDVMSLIEQRLFRDFNPRTPT